MAEYTMTEYVSVWLNDTAGYPTFVYETKEPIVRCKDCRFAVEDAEWCKFEHENLGVQWRRVKPDGFCKWGERITAIGGDSGAVR